MVTKFSAINNPISYELAFDSAWTKYFSILTSNDTNTVINLIILYFYIKFNQIVFYI